MSRHAATASTDPTRISPKVTAGLVTGGALTALAGIAAAFLMAVPQDAVEGLGVWSAPVFVAIGVAGTALAGYAKRDPARDPLPPQVSSPDETGEYASNFVEPDQIPTDSLVLTEDQAVTDPPVEQPAALHLTGEQGAGAVVHAVDDDPVARLARQVSA